MARYENALTTAQVRTIIKAVEKAQVSFIDENTIEETALAIMDTLTEIFPEDFTPENYNRALACALSACAKKGVKDGDLLVCEYIGMLADWKASNENKLNDLGAFGDLFEILIRCALVKIKSFIRPTMLSVKKLGESDVTSKKYGKLEIGHNGKTLTFGTLFDYMDGDYDSIIYGVFSDEDKKAVYDYCRQWEFEKAIDYVCEYSVLWENKYDFQKDMDSLTRGKGIAKKGDNIQVVFNPGKYNAFVQALEDGRFTSLSETLGRKKSK